MQSRYWSYTAKYVARAVLPDVPGARELHDMIFQEFQHDGTDYLTGCLDTAAGDSNPVGFVESMNSMFLRCPELVLVESRLISQEEYRAWQDETDRFAKEEVEYLCDERAEPPEW